MCTENRYFSLMSCSGHSETPRTRPTPIENQTTCRRVAASSPAARRRRSPKAYPHASNPTTTTTSGWAWNGITATSVRRRWVDEHAHRQQIGHVDEDGEDEAADEQSAQDPAVELEVHEVADHDHELQGGQHPEGGVVEVHAGNAPVEERDLDRGDGEQEEEDPP